MNTEEKTKELIIKDDQLNDHLFYIVKFCEQNQGEIINVSLLKNLTGGDPFITCNVEKG